MRSFFALVRREYLEHRGAFLYAPMILIGVVTLLIVFSFLSGRNQLSFLPQRIESPLPDSGFRIFEVGYFAIAVLWLGYLAITLFFYFADAFSADRRNNAMLFWKSMPQGDYKILMSKLVAGLTVLPALVFLALLLTGVVAAVATLVAPLILGLGGMPDVGSIGAAFGQITALALLYLVLALLWYAPFFAWIGALSTVVGRWSIPLALLLPVVAALFEGVADFRTAPGGSYILSYLRRRLTFDFAGIDLQVAIMTNQLADLGTLAGRLVGGVDWPQLVGGLVFAAAVVFVASLYRRRVIKG